jgi:hypothetical protein
MFRRLPDKLDYWAALRQAERAVDRPLRVRQLLMVTPEQDEGPCPT